MPNAALRTEGKTMTHSDLSKRSLGMSSGTFRISSITDPAFSRRSVSFASSAARAGSATRARAIRNESAFLMSLFLLEVEQVVSGAGDSLIIEVHLSQRNARIEFPCPQMKANRESNTENYIRFGSARAAGL